MKHFFSSLFLLAFTFISFSACAQEKAKKSPAATVKQTIASGATITINYNSPSLKGRTIGKDVEPKDDTLWRAGANEATTFETDKDVTVEGQALPAGKYAIFIMKKGDESTIIFNKVWKTWGAYDYEKNKAENALQVTVKNEKATPAAEKLAYNITKDGKVSLNWGAYRVSFMVK